MASHKRGRIATSPVDFNVYINNSDNRLQDTEPTSGNQYWQQLGLTSTNASDWNDKCLFWNTPTTGLYDLYNNPATSTSIIKAQVKEFIADFRAFANPLLHIIAASPNATEVDEKAFNLVLNKNRKKASHSHTKIADQCYTYWDEGAWGEMKAFSRNGHEGGYSLAAGADGVQYAYVILDGTPEDNIKAMIAAQKANDTALALKAAKPTLPDPELVPMPPAPPLHPSDGTTKEFFSGATHQFSFGADKRAKYLYVWSRWYNSKHPELAGDWNSMQMLLIN
ncbi:MAG TPA: hypothetical protein VF411_14520 [Bacteroidia bacterium]